MTQHAAMTDELRTGGPRERRVRSWDTVRARLKDLIEMETGNTDEGAGEKETETARAGCPPLL